MPDAASGPLGSLFDFGQNFWGKVLLTADTLSGLATAPENWQEILAFHGELITDEYTQYSDAYYREAHRRYGRHWRYWDIINVLYSSSKALQPRNYLEIGVRRGRSLCTVVRGCPSVNVTAFDMWMQGYAGMENPGPKFVEEQAARHGHTGKIAFRDGDSRVTVPAFFKENPDMTFDLITVDGDHSEKGAWTDLTNVVQRLALGGVLVFDDISHPLHPPLEKVWNKFLKANPQLQAFSFRETGYGVGFAIRAR